MENKEINIEVVKTVAKGLQELKQKVAFVGGAVISLYADDPAADEVRPTRDIDITVDLRSFSDWAKMQERLAELGFSPAADEKVICRYKFHDIIVDIMPSEDSSIGPSNPWYKPGLKELEKINLEADLYIFTLPLPYFLATKFSAFRSRGKGDYRTSHDFEDIIYITDNRINFVDEIRKSTGAVKEFLQEQYRLVLKDKYKEEIISCHLSSYSQDRLSLILEKIKSILD
ncbi:MAG TPA: nucleotidyl transferase AbiEii/AbiGii toxin family protein [Cytophagaceae bacterium]|jgi:hypothetical protein|nr:nucleotidyl transferase AbiEii/AbiGii toxin family protein [Cytophagaceae bacterium]